MARSLMGNYEEININASIIRAIENLHDKAQSVVCSMAAKENGSELQ